MRRLLWVGAVTLLALVHMSALAACEAEVQQVCGEQAKIDQYHSQSQCLQGYQHNIDQLRQSNPEIRRQMLANTNVALAQPAQLQWFEAQRAVQLCAIKAYSLKVAASPEEPKLPGPPQDKPIKPQPKDKCSTLTRPPAADGAGNRQYCECSGRRHFGTTANGWRCANNDGSGFYGCTKGADGWSCIAN